MRILGISCYYHDSASCIIEDGRIVAAAGEERFSRVKHDNRFPARAIQFCLSWAGVKIEEVDRVVFYEKPIWKLERVLHQHLAYFPRSRRMFTDAIGSWFDARLGISKTIRSLGYTGAIDFIPHHLSHAASAYYPSPFTEAAIVTLDGVGEWATTTIGLGRGVTIRMEKEIRFPHSLGLLYSALTAYLGFRVNDAEYKVMGLASYGDPRPFRRQMDELVHINGDGSYRINMKYFDWGWADHMYNGRLEELFGVKRRSPEAPMAGIYENIAAALQEKLERTVFTILKAAYRMHPTPNLCLAGGVALNCVVNGKITRETPFRNVYIPPDPGDGGGAMGAALAVWHRHAGKKTAYPFSPALGPSYDVLQMQEALIRNRVPYRQIDNPKMLLHAVSDLLVRQKIVGWFQGRMEWGPRALGSRSILASAAREEMKDIINAKVKHRELFRPFAPAIIESAAGKYLVFDSPLPESARHMLLTYPATARGKKEIPAAVHVDGTCRPQVVRRTDNPLYFDLISLYGKKTGSPVVINTSFNVRGEPIVESPADAVHCFLATDIDYLVMGPFIARKPAHG